MTWRDKEKFAVFAGTTEGREICHLLLNKGKRVDVFVATEYGVFAGAMEKNISVHVGRLEAEDMEWELERLDCDMVIDATHPYACVVSENIQKCCKNLKLEYVRILRRESWDKGENADNTHIAGDTEQYNRERIGGEHVLTMENMQKAAKYLAAQQGNIFLTTGSKDLDCFTEIPNYQERLYVRVLPAVTSIQKCSRCGIQGKHIIGMQGPFSVNMNMASFLECRAKFVVTKESGSQGGFLEKLKAAEKAGCTLIVVKRPKQELGMTLREFCEGK